MTKAGATHKMGGFTLPEVMAVVIIVGILMAVALPMYDTAMQKGRRAEAMRALLEMASRQERFYAQNSRYTELDVDADNGLDMEETTSEGGYYDLTAAADASTTNSINTSFVLSAAPNGIQADDLCGTFTLNNRGERDAARDDCW